MISALIRIIEWYPYCGALIEHLSPTHASRLPDGHRRTLTGPRIEAQRPSPRILRRQSVPHMDRTIQSRPARAGAAAAVDHPADQCECSTARLSDCAVDDELVLACALDLELLPPCVPQRRASERADEPTAANGSDGAKARRGAVCPR